MWMEPAVEEEAASKTPKMTALREWRRKLKEWLAQAEAEDAGEVSESEEESNSKATSAETNSSKSNSNTADD
jgi:hypothetical protein